MHEIAQEESRPGVMQALRLQLMQQAVQGGDGVPCCVTAAAQLAQQPDALQRV